MPSVDADAHFEFLDTVSSCMLCKLPFGLCQWRFMNCYGEVEFIRDTDGTEQGIEHQNKWTPKQQLPQLPQTQPMSLPKVGKQFQWKQH